MDRRLVVAVVVGMACCAIDGSKPHHPSDGTPSPSLMEAPMLDVQRLARTDDCAQCHADVASHWTHSAHANASFDNPWYRASVDRFRSERGREKSRFCAGCHDPLLLLSGRIDEEVTPDDPLAYAGITCLVCHSVEATRPDGNASFVLSGKPVLIPDPAVPGEIEAHRASLSMQPLRSAELCGTCHRSFSGAPIGNPHHLRGIDDLGDWASSAYSGGVQDHLVSVDAQTCQGCHMRAVPASDAELAGAHDGVIRSHRWASAHTALTSQVPDSGHAVQAREALKRAVSIDVGAVQAGSRTYVLPEEARVHGTRRLTFDVFLQNERVGHRFPGGARDLHDVWLEVKVYDAEGRLLGASEANRDDREDVFLLRATVLDSDAKPEVLHQVHRFSTPAFDRTLAAHDAQAVRYSIELPVEPALPLRIEARLLHRKHSPVFQAFACEASRTARGTEFAQGALRQGKVALDPCKQQLVTEVAHAVVWMGRGASSHEVAGGAARSVIERLLTQGLALLRGKQEDAAHAEPSIVRAQTLARKAKSPVLQSRAFVLRARLAAIQGRPEEAVAFTRRAEALIGPSPVLDRVRGDAYAAVWRWSRAAEAYERVVQAAPRDHRAWQNLARAYGSLSKDRDALRASESGLHLAPRDEGLLRSRALALEALGHRDAAEATDRWLEHRTPDSKPELLARCEQTHDRCRRDRQPIPHYTLAPRTKGIHASIDPG